MKNVLYLLIVILSISCSKDNPDDQKYSYEDVISIGDSQISEFLNSKILKNIFEGFPTHRRIDDSAFFSGKLKDSLKFGFIGFNLNTKEKLFDLITFEHTSITLDLPYGEKETIDMSKALIHKYINNGNNAQLISIIILGDSNNVVFFYFIKDNKVTNIINPTGDNGSIHSHNMVLWNQNFIIFKNYSHRPPLNTLYDPSGKIIIEDIKYLDIRNESKYVTLNDFEGIIYNGSSLTIVRYNLKI